MVDAIQKITNAPTMQHIACSRKFQAGVFASNGASVGKCDHGYVGRITRNINIFGYRQPISLEYYTSISAPDISPLPGIRLIFWNKIKESESESNNFSVVGFVQMRGPFSQTRAPLAYLNLSGLTLENYFSHWSSSMKNHRNRWLLRINEGVVIIKEVGLDDFTKEYRLSDIKKPLKEFYIKQMSDFKKAYDGDMKFFLVIDSSGKILAGTCIVDDFETQQSIYQYAFVDKSKEYKYIGVGIIDFCIKHTFDQGFDFLNLTAIWNKYQPSSWKGLTAFKMQFQPKILSCRKAYIKILMKF